MRPRLGRARPRVPARAPATRQAWFPEAGGYIDTSILDRHALAAGATITGPAIVEDPDCTAVMLPGDVARMSDKGHIIIDMPEEASQ